MTQRSSSKSNQVLQYRIIGLVGQKYAGKDTVAQLLGYRFPNSSFIAAADPVKETFDSLGREIVPNYDDYSKAETLPVLGVSKRHGYVTLGTKWGREMINLRLWSIILYRRIIRRLHEYSETLTTVGHETDSTTVTIFVTDVRFPDEAEVIRSLNGTLLFIERTVDGKPYRHPDDPQDPADKSETSISQIDRQPHDYLVFNNGSLADLKHTVPPLAVSLLETAVPQTFDANTYQIGTK
jgi:hypothetical protein